MSRTPRDLEALRAQWRYTGQERPPFAREPAAGRRSVWDFPRPPRLEPVPDEVEVRAGRATIARSRAALRVLETGAPPCYYLPPADVVSGLLRRASGRSFCEWKGEAVYWDLRLEGETRPQVAWSYPEPFPEFEALRDWPSFYPGRVECFVGGTQVLPQPGGYYGGWITPDLEGPFKGEPGTDGL